MRSTPSRRRTSSSSGRGACTRASSRTCWWLSLIHIFARALLKKPKILILDDSTSAVDTRTDALIREGFKSYIPETTKIIIAQRVASVQDADLILVMDGGAIAASGTHEELLKTSEIYREVYESQTNGGDENA